MSTVYLEAIHRLVVEKGKQSGRFWKATITTQDVLDRLALVEINRSHHMYARKVAENHHPGTRVEAVGVNGSKGWILHLKIRSK